MGARLIDLTGKTFGRWTVLGRSNAVSPPRWQCRCDCGTERTVLGVTLRSGQTKSCRCIGTERVRALGPAQRGDDNPRRKSARVQHGLQYVSAEHPWYRRASSIRSRCKADGVEFGFSSLSECAAYLISIAPLKCPVFGIELRTGAGAFAPDAPSVDRIRSERGYVRGNLQVMSFKANAMKANASAVELEMFARWVLKL